MDGLPLKADKDSAEEKDIDHWVNKIECLSGTYEEQYDKVETIFDYIDSTSAFYKLLGSLYGLLVAGMILYLLYRKCFRNKMLQKIQWILMIF